MRSLQFVFKRGPFASVCLALGLALPGTTTAGELVFQAVDVPAIEADKAATRTTASATLDGKPFPLSFTSLLRGGQRYGAGTFAAILNAEGRPVKDGQGTPVISDYPDFTSLLPVSGRLFGVTHFESLPSALYLSRFNQDRRTGKLSTIETRSLRLSHIGGIYNPCAGVVTAWGTHLGGEEYPPDVRLLDEAVRTADKTKLSRWVPQNLRYFGINPREPDFAAIKARFQPYRYGYPFEVTVKGWFNVDVVRHQAMGRFSHELAYVMPDRRTVYMSDDGDNGGFFMYVADRPGDLAAGRLFAARWEQTSPAGGAEATAKLTWVDLGHARSADIARAIEGGTRFEKLFEAVDMTEDGQCPAGFGAVNFIGDQARRAGECLKVQPGQEIIASRLETRRFAALKGATTEFTKAEGITYDPKRRRLLLSLTSIDRGMGDGTDKGRPSDRFDRGGANHIKLGYNPCGAVFALGLARDARIGSEFVAESIAPLIAGKPDPRIAAGGVNACALDGIANPDNLTVIPEHDTLIIAEDSDGRHENDSIWAFDMGTAKMTRIMTVPAGGEASGVYWYPNINGHGYLTAVVQHPFGNDVEKRGIKPPASVPNARAAVVGVIGPFPVAPSPVAPFPVTKR